MSERLLCLLVILTLTPSAAALAIGPITVDAGLPIPVLDAHAGPVSVDGAQLAAPVERALGASASDTSAPMATASAPAPIDLTQNGAPSTAPSDTSATTAPPPTAPSPPPASALALALGAALVGLLIASVRGPLARVRGAGAARAWKLALALVLLALGVALVLADTVQQVSNAWYAFWLAASIVAWFALALGATAVARTGRVGRVKREHPEAVVI